MLVGTRHQHYVDLLGPRIASPTQTATARRKGLVTFSLRLCTNRTSLDAWAAPETSNAELQERSAVEKKRGYPLR